MTQNNSSPSSTKAALTAALVGAIVGGTKAAVHGIKHVKNGTATKEEVARNVACEAGTTGLAAGTAGAVVGAFNFGPIVSSLGIVAVAAGVKYGMNSLIGSQTPAVAQAGNTHAPLQTDQPEAQATPKKAASKKASTKKAAPKKKTAKKVTAKKATPQKATTSKKAASKKAASKKPSTSTTTGTPTETAEKK